MIIYISGVDEWEKIKGQDNFISPDFKEEGFIHCSHPFQTSGVLNKHFSAADEVILVCIDPENLRSDWRSEDLRSRGEEFPHIYGPVNREAVVRVVVVKRADDGFLIPESILTND